MAASLEIIDFKRPDESEKNLYVTGISRKLSEQEVHVSFDPKNHKPLFFLIFNNRVKAPIFGQDLYSVTRAHRDHYIQLDELKDFHR